MTAFKTLLAVLYLLLLPLTLQAEKPNILWIISEDNSTYLGCYGDPNANTPHLDALAAKGMRYTNCFANAPVCAPARSTLFLGMHATSAGTYHMRSRYLVPKYITPYFTHLKDAGYFTTNGKSDINTNTHNINRMVDAKSVPKQYLGRPDKSKPFVAVHNMMQSHESGIFVSHPKRTIRNPTPGKKLEHPLTIPAYQVDNAETRLDWARIYTQIDNLDKGIGQILNSLEKSGEAENTIILYCSDHAGIMIRSKRYLFDSGTRVPMIAYFPKKWEHLAPKGYAPGAVSDRLVDFTDIPKTILTLAGAEVPKHFVGKAFAGKEEPAKEKILLFSGRFDECPDNSRALTDGRYKYLRNYESDRQLNQLESYCFNQISQQTQYKVHQAGKTNEAQASVYDTQPVEAFFDTQADPHEVQNLINSSEHQELIAQFRSELDQYIIKTHDLGFIPEPLIAEIDQSTTVYEWAQSQENYPLPEILALANTTGQSDAQALERFTNALSNSNRIIRFWGALGLRVAGDKASGTQDLLKKALKDSDASVRIVAACTLGQFGMNQTDFLLNEAKIATTDAHANWALDALKLIGVSELPDGLEDQDFIKGSYSQRSYEDLRDGKTYTKLAN